MHGKGIGMGFWESIADSGALLLAATILMTGFAPPLKTRWPTK
jgi:hypothetical protein